MSNKLATEVSTGLLAVDVGRPKAWGIGMICELLAYTYKIVVITYPRCTKESIAMADSHSLCARSDSEIRKIHTGLTSTHDVHISVFTKLISRLQTG